MFKFFYFSNNLLIWSWLSNSWVMKVINLFVEFTFMNSINSYNLIISILLSLLTLRESAYKSGFSLNSLHNFFVLSFKIIDKLAISASICCSSFFWVIWVNVALFLTSSAYLLSFSYWFLRSLLISKPASSLLMSSCTLTESRNLKLMIDSSMIVLSLKLSMKFIENLYLIEFSHSNSKVKRSNFKIINLTVFSMLLLSIPQSLPSSIPLFSLYSFVPLTLAHIT